MSEAASIPKPDDSPARVEGDLAAVCSPYSGERLGCWHSWGGQFAVRPPDEFALGYLPGAVNIPLRELEGRLAEMVPRERSSLTAARLIAFSHSRRSRRSAREAISSLGSRMVVPNGRAAGLPILSGSIERKI